LAVVSVAILISFHLKHQASELEKKIALPLGIVFWVLVSCLTFLPACGLRLRNDLFAGYSLLVEWAGELYKDGESV
jgi:hypothetical protein